MARHQSVEEKMGYFTYEHLGEDLQNTSRLCSNLATEILNEIPKDSPQLALGLQKLIEAKDCFVRAKLDYLKSR